MKKTKSPKIYILLIFISALAALNYKVFVFPNSFAPAGVDGICTMIQHLTGTSMGYLALSVNVPLLIIGSLFVGGSFIKRTAVYTVAFSVFTVILSYIDLSAFLYHTDTGTSIVLAPIAAGTIRGLLYAVTLRVGGSGGGVDIIAAIVKKYKPYYSLMNIIFIFNVAIALCSYFVYGFKAEPVICSIIYSFITNAVSKSVEASEKENVRFEIITDNADLLCKQISEELGITSTVVDARGGYSGCDKKLLICVTSKEATPKLEKILQNYPDAVTFESTITSEKIKRY